MKPLSLVSVLLATVASTLAHAQPAQGPLDDAAFEAALPPLEDTAAPAASDEPAPATPDEPASPPPEPELEQPLPALSAAPVDPPAITVADEKPKELPYDVRIEGMAPVSDRLAGEDEDSADGAGRGNVVPMNARRRA